MALSFGIAQKIADSPFYNLGFALPFACAFYIINAGNDLLISFWGINLGADASALIWISLIGLYYMLVVMYIVFASYFSVLTKDSPLYWALPILILSLIHI